MHVYSIGHSRRSTAELIALLQAADVKLLIDVRAIPRSRFNPQFNREALCDALAAQDIAYRHMAALGGRRGRQDLGVPSPNSFWREESFRNYADYALSPSFQAALHDLIDLATGWSCAIMCAEAAWQNCHRQIITDYLLAAGLSVTHLFGPDRSEKARLNANAALQTGGRIHYPAAQGSLL